MLYSPRRIRSSFLAALTLLAISAAAQRPGLPAKPAPALPLPAQMSPKPLPTPLPVPAAPAPAVDPKVAVLFDRAIAAHQALTGLSAVLSITTQGPGVNAVQTLTLAYKKPGEARIAVADTAGPIVQFISDGKTLTIYAVKDKKYRTQPVPPGADVIPAVLDQAHALLPRLIAQPESLRDLLLQPGVSATLGTPDSVGGVPTDTVIAVLPAPDGSKVQFTFAIGTADHLLRRMAQATAAAPTGGSPAFTHTETITRLDTAPALTAADFAWTPPPGVTPVKAAAPKKAAAIRRALPKKAAAAKKPKLRTLR